jgi:hypothetical protein
VPAAEPAGAAVTPARRPRRRRKSSSSQSRTMELMMTKRDRVGDPSSGFADSADSGEATTITTTTSAQGAEGVGGGDAGGFGEESVVWEREETTLGVYGDEVRCAGSCAS